MRHPTLLLLLALTACGSKRLRELPPYVDVQGVGDSFESSLSVSTKGYAKPAELLLGQHDAWFVGYIDKDTREIDLELHMLTSSGMRRAWSSARLGGPEGDERICETVSERVDCTDLGCVHWEQVVVELTLGDARRFVGEGGQIEVTGDGVALPVAVDPAEVAGLLSGLDAAAGPGNPLRR